MDNKQFPEENGIPEPEETPVIQDLSFVPEPPEEEADPIPEETPFPEEVPVPEPAPLTDGVSPSEELPTPEPVPFAEEPSASEEPPMPEPPAQEEPAPSFMDRIPDVEADYPPQPQDPLTEPQLGQEITPDEHAIKYNGLLDHGEEEPPFDMDLLNEFAPPAEPEPPQEEVDDQEYRDNGSEFNDMFEASAPEDQVPSHQRPTRKGRPKRKKGEGFLGIPNILVTIVWLALIVAIGVTAGRMLWVCAADVLAFGREDKPVTITIYEADTMEDITNKLYDAGLIRYKSLFNLYASISDAKEDIQPGIYDLNTRYDYHALVNFMTPRSSREVIQLTIPEGYTCRQIFNLLEENRICTAVDIGAYAASGELDDYWFLENVTRGTDYCLEGFLFPDTYQFYKNSTPREALEKMLDNFNVRFSEEMRAQIDTLNAEVTGGGYTVREVTIVASLIEKESAAPSESPKIAGVIYNRLFRWGDTPAYLNIDATLVYAQNGDNSTIDTHMDSPYNTYTNIGLTPTPIANPGLSSLQAALNPDMHDYYYYVLNPATGMHQFSETLEEHEAYRAQFAAATEG